MQEIYEFRVLEVFAHLLFSEDEGKKLGFIRLIEISPDDSRFPAIGEHDRRLGEEHDRAFFLGWHIRRKYSRKELDAAQLFQLLVDPTMAPSGEECGTSYDDANACPECGAGAPQLSDLRLDLRKMPKQKDITCTIAGEVVITQRLAEILIEERLNGFELRRVHHKAMYENDAFDLRLVPSGRELLRRAIISGNPFPDVSFWVWVSRGENRPLCDQAREEYALMKQGGARHNARQYPIWYQLIPTERFDIADETVVGIEPFDLDVSGDHRCSHGDTIGLNQISSLWLKRRSFTDIDMAASSQFVGTRRGLIRPRRLIVISRRFRKLLEDHKVKKYQCEIVNLSS